MSHDHTHDHTDYQPDIEDFPFTDRMVMTQAIAELIVEKGICTADELRQQIELMDSKEPALGARLVAKTWVDSEFKSRVLDDCAKAAAEIGIDIEIELELEIDMISKSASTSKWTSTSTPTSISNPNQKQHKHKNQQK